MPDADILSRVCGANDSNLKLIEEHLGAPVFTRGNELSVDGGDPALREKFRFIIDRVLDEMRDGGGNGRDIVSAVLASPRANLAKFSIAVPGGFRKVYPRTEGQARYIDAMRKKDLTLCTGPAGSGKTFLAVAESLRLLLSRDKAKLILTRPVLEAGESLGFLPGDMEQKIGPYLRPLYDAMEALLPRETVRRLIESGAVETAPLAYMRGRTLSSCAVIFDEAQNATKAQMKMFLTRMGENAKVFITGDVTQIDLPRREDSGLAHAAQLLNSIDEVGVVALCADDVIRAPLVRKIVKAYASCAAPATGAPRVRGVSSERAQDNNFY